VNHRYQVAFYALWIAHPVLQSAVAAAMIQRKLYRTFPFFFAYVIAQIVIFAILFSVYRANAYELFFYLYWATTVVSVGLGFKVIHEIFVDIFRPYHTLRDLGSVLFKWAGLVMLLVAGVVAASSPMIESGPLVQAVLTLQRSVRVVQCGLIFFLLVFSKYLGISWKQRSFGIALGFGGFASLELAMLALRVGSYISEPTLSLLNMGAYNCAIVTWFVYACVESAGREATTTLLKSQRWEQSLTEIQHPAAADSLIPMFEGMVDRAFSRTTQYSHEISRDAREHVLTTQTTSVPVMELPMAASFSKR
jgi:predicted membrane protein